VCQLNLKGLRGKKLALGVCTDLTSFPFRWFLAKWRRVFEASCSSQDGKEHVYYSLCESIRLSRDRTIQRRVLNLGELNTTQIEPWQRSIEVIEQEGQTRQYRLFTDREGAAPAEAPDVCEVVLSSLSVRRPREFGACWLA
jgi:hypothetical protein